MLFATQNPPGLYAGRKVLSRAFQNRFLELHIGDLPNNELSIIINKRCGLAPRHCNIMIEVMKELQQVRQESQIFAGKHGFITTRDLLRWANRQPAMEKELAEHGFMLLGERLRRESEKETVRKVLEKHCKTTLDIDEMYERKYKELMEDDDNMINKEKISIDSISMTTALKRLFVLMSACITTKEPVLLVGNTGCGKTTVCQLLSMTSGIPLTILNCHQHTETADMVGGLRPVRNKESIFQTITDRVKQIINMIPDRHIRASNVSKQKCISSILANRDIKSMVEECQEIIAQVRKNNEEHAATIGIDVEGHFQAIRELQKNKGILKE